MYHYLDNIAEIHKWDKSHFKKYALEHCSYMINDDMSISSFYVNDLLTRYEHYIHPLGE